MINKIISYLLQPSHLKRTAFFLICDSIIIICALYISFKVRFEFSIPPFYWAMFIKAIPLFLLIKISVFSLSGLYRFTWRYVDIGELNKIYIAMAIATSVLMISILIPYEPQLAELPLPFIKGFPRSIFFIDALICSLVMAGLRISKRLYLEKILHKSGTEQGVNTIIVGAGNTGEMILRDIYQRGYSDFYPVGLLDDDDGKIGGYIRGIKVIGPVGYLRQAIAKMKAKALIIAIPSLNHKILKEIYSTARESGLKHIKIVPRIYDFHRPDINLKNLEEISIEDLIGRQSVEVDYAGISCFIEGRTVLITGAGGSIGSELVMQVCSFEPARLILFDIDETSLHTMSQKIGRAARRMADRCEYTVGDVRDSGRVAEVFTRYRPDIIFHAAAYKHVPMMEANPKEAVKVNIFGTYNIAEAAAKYGASKFILISTDKAIRPTSIMGASKRVAEYICNAFSRNAQNTEYLSVRFGNVLGSRGSVLPMFLDQLRHGGPITVTHPEMRRYFMTIPEAVSLVLQASVLGKGGEVMVLDMGEPVTIVSLAEELVKLHGMKPYEDIDIIFTGLRPGEKLFEEILTAEEGSMASKHKKIFIARNDIQYTLEEVRAITEELKYIVASAEGADCVQIKNVLKKHVKYYKEIQ